MDHKDKVAVFKALGDPTRLRIFEFLYYRCCPVAVTEEGDDAGTTEPTVGDVCCCLTGSVKVSSTMVFHFKELREAGLITMERRGRNTVCGVNREVMASLATYFVNPNVTGSLPMKEVKTMNETTGCCGGNCCCGANCTCGDNCNCGK